MTRIVRLGISSGCAPDARAAQLATVAVEAGSTVVDLRAGKGHQWEEDGLDALFGAGLDVSFIGHPLVLGDPTHPLERWTWASQQWPGIRCKVVADVGAGQRPDLVGRQLGAIAGDRPDLVLVETHAGFAHPADIAVMATRHGCRVVLDTRGLADSAGNERDRVLPLLAPHVDAIQCKQVGSDGRHVPLGDDGRPPVMAAFRAVAGGDRPIDVLMESRAFVPHRDLRLLGRWWQDASSRPAAISGPLGDES